MDTTELALSRTFKFVDGALQEFDAISNQPAAEFKDSPSPGTLIDSKYEIISLIGRGGMGAVYKVRHVQLNKEVALKTFLTTSLSDDAWLRFQREAQSIARLNDVNIVKIFDFGISDKNIPYYTMELLHGQSLAEKLAQSGYFNQTDALRCFSKVAQGLLHAHKLNIIHRDIKPGNIFLCQEASGAEPGVKLVDFGIAKLLTDQTLDSQKLTHTGIVFGSPLYMSPEPSLGQTVDEKSDIYSFGCTLFESLTGTAPFAGANAFTTMTMHQNQRAPSLSQRNPRVNYDPRLEQMMAKMLAKSSKSRYQSFEEVIRDLTHLANDSQTVLGQSTSDVSNSAMNGTAPDTENAYSDTGARNLKSGTKKILLTGGLAIAIIATLAGLALTNLLQNKTVAGSSDVAATHSSVVAAHPATDARTPATTSAHDESHPATDATQDTRSFYSTLSPNGTRTFHFGKDDLGTLYLMQPKHQELQTVATGTISVAPAVSVRLSASTRLANKPALFDRFRKDDFSEIKLDKGPLWTREHLSKLTAFTEISKITIFDADLDDKFFADLDNFKRLISLEIPDCQASANEILKYKHLDNLNNFTCDSIKSVSPVISKLSTSKTLSSLSMEQCNLTDNDLRMMAKIKTLTTLHLAYNDKFTAEGVKSLSSLPLLRALYMEGINFSPSFIPAFKDFKCLSRLRINTSGWPDSARSSLKAILPVNCIVSDSGKVKL